MILSGIFCLLLKQKHNWNISVVLSMTKIGDEWVRAVVSNSPFCFLKSSFAYLINISSSTLRTCDVPKSTGALGWRGNAAGWSSFITCSLCSCSAQGCFCSALTTTALLIPYLHYPEDRGSACPVLLATTIKSQKTTKFSTRLKVNKFKARTATGTFTFQTFFSKHEIPNTFRTLGLFIWKKGIWFQWQLKKIWI